jgi:hypothetical protein
MTKMKKLAASAAAGAAVLGVVNSAEADFTGFYAPGNWTTTGTQGSATNDGVTLQMISGNAGVGATANLPNVGTLSYTISAAGSGLVSFDWFVPAGGSPDDGTWDYFGVILNGVYSGPNAVGSGGQTGLGNNDTPEAQTLSFSFSVNQGETFGFFTHTRDGGFGGLTANFTNFSAPIPEPTSVALLALGSLAGLGIRRRSI